MSRASMVISLGDRAKCRFWQDHWLGGCSLKIQFPNLFAIASRKHRSVQKELINSNLIRALSNISSAARLVYFVDLWTRLQAVLLLQRPDTITWRWTESGVYSTVSAYKCQFIGSCPPFQTSKIWRAHTEPKCRFFAWLVLHGKLLTADNLVIRG